MKYFSILIVVLFALATVYFFTQPTLIDSGLKQAMQLDTQPSSASQVSTPIPAHDHTGTSATTTAQQSNVDTGKTGNPHYDQLTPEMQQALKDQLLLENTTETIEGNKGAIIIPSSGRFTQMPVAVQMPDGSIQIREYSSIPKPQAKPSK